MAKGEWTPFMVWWVLTKYRWHKLIYHSFGRTCGREGGEDVWSSGTDN